VFTRRLTCSLHLPDNSFIYFPHYDCLIVSSIYLFKEVCSLPTITDGHVSSTSKTIFKSGDQVTITCNSGYAPSSLDATCQSDRSWVPEPSCRYVTCATPSIQYGYYTNNGNQISISNLPYGTTIQPLCSQTGYTPSPSTVRTCLEDGQWSGSDPSCIPSITCNSLPLLANGYYDSSNNAPYVYNEEISPTCYEGYYLNGSAVTRRCIANNTWGGDDPACLRITCSAPRTLNNGSYNASQSTYNYGNILVLTCDNSYYVSNNTDTKRTCVGKDTWNGSDPICQRIMCFQPSTISNGRYNNVKSSYDFESVIQPICDQGYTITNNVTHRICNQYNTWSGKEPTCSIVTCNRPASYLNGWLTPNQSTYNYNTTVVVSCNDGYEIKKGTVHRTCFEDGTWGPVPIDCVKIICNDTVNVSHESINEYPAISFNEVARVIYNSSFFHLQEGSTEVNCSADRKLSWTRSPLFGW